MSVRSISCLFDEKLRKQSPNWQNKAVNWLNKAVNRPNKQSWFTHQNCLFSRVKFCSVSLFGRFGLCWTLFGIFLIEQTWKSIEQSRKSIKQSRKSSKQTCTRRKRKNGKTKIEKVVYGWGTFLFSPPIFLLYSLTHKISFNFNLFSRDS